MAQSNLYASPSGALLEVRAVIFMTQMRQMLIDAVEFVGWVMPRVDHYEHGL